MNMLSVKGTCEFCGRPRNDILYGPLHKQKDIKCHYYCLLFSHVLDQNGSDDEGILGFLLPDIRKALLKGKDVRCSYCHQPGALSKCFNSKCRRTFHLPCGIERGSLHLYFGDFRSFCSEHRHKQRVPPDVLNRKDVLCSVCFDPVEDLTSNDSLWAPCCKKNGWFHRLCIQKFALSAAYFFKCPLCANQKKFRDAMLKNGIYIPDQDASWELEPNAFAELLERHNKCDAAVCKCPKGRDHNSENPSDDDGMDIPRLWTLILCQNCGSKGIHTGCIPGPRSSVQNRSSWDCPECQTVMKNCSLHREEILSMSRQSVSGDESEDDVIVVDEDVVSAYRNDSKVIISETTSASQDIKTVLSSAIHLVSSSSAEVVDLVDDDEDDIMELTGEDEDNTLHDEKLHVLIKQDNVFQPPRSGNSLAYVPKEVTQSPELSVFQPSSSWIGPRPSWSPLSHEVGSPAISPIIFESRRELWSPQGTPRSITHFREFQDSKSRRNLEISYCFTSCENNRDYSCSSHHSRLSPISSGKKKLFKIKRNRKKCGKCRKVTEKNCEKFYEPLFNDGWSEIFNDLKNVWFSRPVNHRNGLLRDSCDKLCRYPMSFSSFKSGKCGNARLKMHWLNMSKWVSGATSYLCVLKCRHTKVQQCHQSLKNVTLKKDMFCDIQKKNVHSEEMYEVFVKKIMMELMY